MNPPVSSSELAQVAATLRPHLVRATAFSIVAALLVLAPTGYMFEVYDRVLSSRNPTTLAMLTLLVLGAYAVMEVLEWARGGMLRDAGFTFDSRLSNRVFDAIFEADRGNPSAGSTQPMSDLRTLREFLHAPVLPALMELPVSLVLLALVFAISPLLGASAVVGALLQTGLTWLSERSTQPALREATRSAVAAQRSADAALREAEAITSMGMLDAIHDRWSAKQREFLRLQAQASDAAGGYQAASRFVQQVLGSLLLGLGAWLLLRGELPGGAAMLIVGSILGARVLAPLVQVVTHWRQVVTVRDAWCRLDSLLRQLPARAASMPLPPPRGVLHVDSLHAGAPGGATHILRGLQFSLSAGEVLAVIGPSASGKTTLARLLLGLWPAASGKVRLDGVDVHGWDRAELGPHIGYLPQGAGLFEGTLAENIARFGEVDAARVEAAARCVGLHDVIVSLDAGYDTPVGADGAKLSGGQRQRVALARALYGEPVFVVLDEPNSSLDEAGEAALAAAIASGKRRGTTFVVITHRKSVLDVVDKMLVLRDGVQQLFGPRDEVMARFGPAAPAVRA